MKVLLVFVAERWGSMEQVSGVKIKVVEFIYLNFDSWDMSKWWLNSLPKRNIKAGFMEEPEDADKSHMSSTMSEREESYRNMQSRMEK